MAAEISIRVQTGSAPGTMSDAVTGIDLISADNAVNSLGNRTANPITVGTRSFEKWIRLRVDVAPANGVSNFLIWGDGDVAANTTLFFGTAGTYATPTANASSVATTDFTTHDENDKATWHAGSLTDVADLTDFAVFQLEVDSAASPGNWPTETVSFSYDEI